MQQKNDSKAELGASSVATSQNGPPQTQPPPVETMSFSSREWLTIAGAWLNQFATFGYLYSFGVYQDYYTRIYLPDSTPSQISWIGSIQFMLSLSFGLVSGSLFDKGYFRHLLWGGAVLYTFSIFMLSLAKENKFYQVFLSQGVGMGFGIGLVFVPLISNILIQFAGRRQAVAMGIILTGAEAGGLVFPIMINHLFAKHSFGSTVRVSAYIVLGCMLGGSGLIKSARPMAMGSGKAEQTSILELFQDSAYTLLMLGSFVSITGIYFPIFYMQLYGVQHHVDNTLAFYSLAIINGMAFVGRFTINVLANYCGVFNLLVASTVATSSVVWGVLGVNDRGSLVAVSVLYGFFSGAVFSLYSLAPGSTARNPSEIGIRNGLFFMFTGIGILIAAPIQGALLTGRFKWLHPIVYSTTAMYVAAVILFGSRTVLARRRGTQVI